MPVSTTEEPHLYQINLASLSKQQQQQEKENRKKLSDEMRRNSALLSFFTSPIFLLADLAVVITVNWTSYKNDSVWTDYQLNSWFLYFFLPAFFIAMLSALSMYKSNDKSITIDNETSKESKTCMSKMKKKANFVIAHVKENYLSDLALLGMAMIIALHSLYVPRTNSYLFGYEKGSELMMFEGRTNFAISKHCKENLCNLDEMDVHINFENKDYRKIKYFEENVIYVSENINVTSIPLKVRIIEDAQDWKDIETKNSNQKICKRCLIGSNPQHQRCSTLSQEGWNIRDCQG